MIAIFDLTYKLVYPDRIYDENSVRIGGSETWTLELSKQLSNDYNVTIYNYGDVTHYDSIGRLWVSKDDTEKYIAENKYDFIICSRLFVEALKLIKRYNATENVIVQAHDYFLDYITADRVVGYTVDNCEYFNDLLIKKFVYLSDWHKASIKKFNGSISDDKMTLIPNGISSDYICSTSSTHNIDHSILWSTLPLRGLDILIYDIMPLVRKAIPDFTVKIATYGDIDDKYYNIENVEVLGCLSRHELYEEMTRHAVYFCPMTINETFNITSIESVLCGQIQVMPIKSGPATAFQNYNGMKHDFETDYENAVQEAANLIIYYITHYFDYNLIQFREEFRNFIINNYTWECVADKYRQLFNSIING